MKITIIYFTLFFTVSFVHAQTFNKEITPENGKSVLLGKINYEKLASDPYSDWFVSNYENYTPKAEVVEQLSEALPEYTIKAFMGTWCGDSKKEVPKFYKVLEEAQFPMDRLTMVAVSRDRATYKQSPGGEEEGLSIHRVPTFIFYKDGKEINRIVEHPKKAIEEDMLAALSSDYQSNYSIVSIVSEKITDLGVVKFQKKTKKIAKQLKPISETLWELNTYGSTLFAANKKEEAIAVLHLNTYLFPKEERTFVALGSKYAQMNELSEAKINFEKALAMNPENEMAKEALKQLTSK